MPYDLPTDAANNTVSRDTHPDLHNDANAAINDLDVRAGVLVPRSFGDLTDVGLTDHTAILQAAIDQAAENYAAGLNERAPTTVLLPRSQLNITQIVKKQGVSIIGSGWSGAVGSTSRLRQLPGVDDDAIIFEGSHIADSNYADQFVLANFALYGRSDSTVGSGINLRGLDTSVDDGRITFQDGNVLRDLFIAGFPEDGIHCEAGMVPGHIYRIRPFGNGGYGINYDVSASDHPTTWGVHFEDISGDANALGVIHIKGVGTGDPDDRDGSFVLTNIKSEKTGNTFRDDVSDFQHDVVVIEDCAASVSIDVDGISHGSSYTPDSGVTYEAPGAAIRVEGTEVPEITFRAVQLLVRAANLNPEDAVTIQDNVNAVTVPRTVKNGRYAPSAAGAANSANAGKWVREVVGDDGEFVPAGAASGGAAGTGIQNPGHQLKGDSPWYDLYNLLGATDLKRWLIGVSTGGLDIRRYNDDKTFHSHLMTVGDTATTVTTDWNFTSGLIKLNGLDVRRGTGSPEGAVNGAVGAIYLRTDGGAGTTIYTKESGTGNTGWAAGLTFSSLDTDGTLAGNSDLKVPSQKAVKTYVDGRLAAADAVIYKGVIDCSANPNYPAADAGHLYRVSVAGKIGGGSGTNVEAGDTLLCLTDGTAAGTQAGVGANWDVIQVNIDGAVVGPASATDAHIPQFDGATGKLLKDGLALSIDGTLAGATNAQIASALAAKTYADSLKTASDAKVAAALGAYKTLYSFSAQLNALGANSRLIWPSTLAVATNASAGLANFYLDPADFAVSGYTTKLRIRLLIGTDDTAPACDFTLNLKPVNTVAGGAGDAHDTLGAATASTSTISSPSANTPANHAESADFNAPTAGAFVFEIVNTSMAANSAVAARVEIAVRWV
jgi:hypothetical protein